MKALFLLGLLSFLTSCEYATLKYGYYWNPVTILSKASQAIETNHLGEWEEVLSGKVLCVYGTREGMSNLRQSMKKMDHSSLQAPELVSSKYLESPKYLGYYSYYQETYVSKAYDSNGKSLLKVTILCDFGSNDHNSHLLKASISKYSVRSCSIVGIKNFDRPLKESEVCADL